MSSSITIMKMSSPDAGERKYYEENGGEQIEEVGWHTPSATAAFFPPTSPSTITKKRFSWKTDGFPKQRDISEQLASLPKEHLETFHQFKSWWVEKTVGGVSTTTTSSSGSRSFRLRTFSSASTSSSSSSAAEVDFSGLQMSDLKLLQFLRASPGAKKFNIETAKKSITRYAKWMQEYDVENLKISDPDVISLLRNGSISITGGYSKDGYMVLNMLPLNKAKQIRPEQTLKVLAYMLNVMTLDEKSAAEGICVCFDMSNMKWEHFTMKHSQVFMEALQNRYPCRVRKFILVGAPSFYNLAWGMIRPMMGEDLANKFVFAKQKNVLEYFGGKEHAPTYLGGEIDEPKVLEEFVAYRCKVEGVRMEDLPESNI